MIQKLTDIINSDTTVQITRYLATIALMSMVVTSMFVGFLALPGQHSPVGTVSAAPSDWTQQSTTADGTKSISGYGANGNYYAVNTDDLQKIDPSDGSVVSSVTDSNIQGGGDTGDGYVLTGYNGANGFGIAFYDQTDMTQAGYKDTGYVLNSCHRIF